MSGDQHRSSFAPPPAEVITGLNEKILSHNTELTAYIARLCADKQQLDGALTALKGKLESSEKIREELSKDVNTLKTSVKRYDATRQESEAVVSELKSEVRRLETELEKGREQIMGQTHYSTSTSLVLGSISADRERDREKVE